jgi:hypothetical protein
LFIFFIFVHFLKAKVKAPAIEDWQLAARYRRRALDAKEVDAINSGGAY